MKGGRATDAKGSISSQGGLPTYSETKTNTEKKDYCSGSHNHVT